MGRGEAMAGRCGLCPIWQLAAVSRVSRSCQSQWQPRGGGWGVRVSVDVSGSAVRVWVIRWLWQLKSKLFNDVNSSPHENETTEIRLSRNRFYSPSSLGSSPPSSSTFLSSPDPDSVATAHFIGQFLLTLAEFDQSCSLLPPKIEQNLEEMARDRSCDL